MFNKVKNIFRLSYQRILRLIEKRPLISFFTALGIFLALIVLSNFLKRPAQTKTETKLIPKNVQVYTIGSAPKIRFQAQIEKSGVVQITALTGGVVQSINFQPGDSVSKGNTLLSLSSNYQGGNAFSLQRQIAQTQYNNVNDTYQTQKDLISKQRELAEKMEDNDEELRDISAKSIDETQAIIDLNNNILSTLDQNLRQYESTNSAQTDNSALILQTRQLKSQFLSANSQLQSAIRNTRFASDDEQEPAAMADLQRDITIKQLDIQEKALDLNKEIFRLQLQVAYVNEALMFPSAPFSASVERVFVKVGQAVQPGTPLMVLSQYAQDDPIIALAYVPREIAQKVSLLEPSILYIDTMSYEAYPAYVTRDAIQGTLYGVYFDIPENYHASVTEKGYIEVDVPVGTYDTSASVPFIPLDSIYQTKDKSYVYVAIKGYAQSKQIKLGQVLGRFVEVESGLSSGDRVIINRNVIDGDAVKVGN